MEVCNPTILNAEDINNFVSKIKTILINDDQDDNEQLMCRKNLSQYALHILKCNYSTKAQSAVDNNCVIQAIMELTMWQQAIKNFRNETSGTWMEIFIILCNKLKVRIIQL